VQVGILGGTLNPTGGGGEGGSPSGRERNMIEKNFSLGRTENLFTSEREGSVFVRGGGESPRKGDGKRIGENSL